jgi:hypothetical protein
MFNFGGADGGHPANFIPFKTIVPYLLGNQGFIIAGANLFFNVILLVPVGILACLAFRNITWKKSLAVAIGAGLSIEIMQAVLRLGIFDVDDVTLNALGVMTGYWTFIVLSKWIGSRQYKNIVIAALIIICMFAGSFYALYAKGQDAGNLADRTASNSGNLCGNTPGNGQIVNISDDTITIKRNDGVLQIIKLTDKTTIKTPARAATKADLKVKDRVTVVINDTETAAAVLVCGT